MILALDISTSYVGWCILKKDGTYVDIGHIDLHLIKDFYEKADKFLVFIQGIGSKSVIQEVWVEEPVKMFRSNASMAQTITKLQRFNAICCWIVRENLGINPNFIMATSARKNAGLKIPKGVRGKETKKYILHHVKNLDIVPEDKWDIKKTGSPKDWCFDQADAFVIALARCKMYHE